MKLQHESGRNWFLSSGSQTVFLGSQEPTEMPWRERRGLSRGARAPQPPSQLELLGLHLGAQEKLYEEESFTVQFDNQGPKVHSLNLFPTHAGCIKIMNIIKDSQPTFPRLGWGSSQSFPFRPSCLIHRLSANEIR